MGRPGRAAICKRGCGAPLRFVRLVESDRTACLDRAPDPAGTVRLTSTPAGLRAVVLQGDQITRATANHERLYTPHATTCVGRRPHNPMPEHLRARPAAASLPAQEENP